MDLNKQNSDQADLIAKKSEVAQTGQGYLKNQKTGMQDFMLGDHSLKRWFKLMAIENQWFWIFLLFATLLVLQLAYFPTVWGWLMDAYMDSTAAGIFTSVGMFIPITGAFMIGYGILYKWWKYMIGEKMTRFV